MKITIEVAPEAAKTFLRDIESKISEKLRARDELNIEIEQLEESANSLREKLQGANGSGIRAPRGENRKRIIEFLKGLPAGKGVKMTSISKSTGISAPSTSYTLKNNKKDFVQDENGLWRLK